MRLDDVKDAYDALVRKPLQHADLAPHPAAVGLFDQPPLVDHFDGYLLPGEVVHPQVHLAEAALANHAANGVPRQLPRPTGRDPRGVPVDLRDDALDLAPRGGVRHAAARDRARGHLENCLGIQRALQCPGSQKRSAAARRLPGRRPTVWSPWESPAES